jgi:putative chitinase
MCIDGSVGQGGHNARNDVVIVQILLNYSVEVPYAFLDVDGSCGPGTREAIKRFQRNALAEQNPTGIISPNDSAILKLQANIPADDLDNTKLRGIMPASTKSKIELYSTKLFKGMRDRAINTKLRQAHFLAQLGHESMSFVYAEEIASGAAYEGRTDLGNTQAGDGVRFKGRGLIQLTGRSNYTAYGSDIGQNLTDGENPKKLAKDPALATDVACWYWDQHNLNSLADADNITAITKAINGGYNGLPDRKAYLKRAKFFLKI